MYSDYSRTIVLLVVYIGITVVAMFYDPWGNVSDESAVSIGFNLIEQVTEDYTGTTKILCTWFAKFLMSGIMEWVNIFAVGVSSLVYNIGGGNWMDVSPLMLTSFISFIVCQFFMIYINDEVYDNNNDIISCIDMFFIENIVSYLFYLANYLITHLLLERFLSWLQHSHRVICGVAVVILIILEVVLGITFFVLYLLYGLVMGVPIFALLLLSLIPGIGFFVNSILGVVLLLAGEFFMIYYVWRNFVSVFIFEKIMDVLS